MKLLTEKRRARLERRWNREQGAKARGKGYTRSNKRKRGK